MACRPDEEEYHFLPFYKSGSRFVNPHCKDAKRGLLALFLWQVGFYDDPRPPKKVPKTFEYPNPKKQIDMERPTACWINHSSFLMQVRGKYLLTDPIWSQRCSPCSFLGPRRHHEPGLKLTELPQIDVVLISHNHYDHLDRKTVRKLSDHSPLTQWIVPIGLGKWMHKQGVRHPIELAWWQETVLDFDSEKKKSSVVVITAVPAQHFSRRTFFDGNKTLWAGYVVDFKGFQGENKRLYFVGDTGYNGSDFKAIGRRFGEMDLSLIPIGAYLPARFMDPVHVNPEKAVLIHKDVGSKMSIGMHFKTFRLSGESLRQPPYDLHRALEKARIHPRGFRLIEPGQHINW